MIDHPAQHFSPGLRVAATENEHRVVALYWDDYEQGFWDPDFDRFVQWDVDLLSGYERRSTDPSRSGGIRAWQAWRALAGLRPRVVVIAGWATPVARLAIVWCRLTRTPHLFYSDASWQRDSRGLRGALRNTVLRSLFRTAGAVSTGTFNREFYVLHGVHPQRIVDGVCPIDVDAIRAAAVASEPSSADARPLVIGFAGKLIPQKGVDELLRAAALLGRDPEWVVRIVGTGPEEAAYRSLAADLGIAERVEFVGFANQSTMPAVLASFDVFVAPSRWDLRILVVAEAMAAGTPVVVSDATAIWGPGDLVRDGETGILYRSGQPSELADALQRLLDHAAERARLAAAASTAVDALSAQAFARQFDEVVRRVADEG